MKKQPDFRPDETDSSLMKLLHLTQVQRDRLAKWGSYAGLIILLLEVPFLANAFGFMPIGITEYAIAMGLAVLVIPVVETVKFFQRKAAK